MDKSKNKRNYVKRKKNLKDCVGKIRTTLDYVCKARGELMNQEDTERLAIMHAQAIEAACWTPNLGLTGEEYQLLMANKTLDLCYAILRKALPEMQQDAITMLLKNAISQPQQNTEENQPPLKPIEIPNSSDDEDLPVNHNWGVGSMVSSFDIGLNGDLPSNDLIHDDSLSLMDNTETLDFSLSRFDHFTDEDSSLSAFY